MYFMSSMLAGLITDILKAHDVLCSSGVKVQMDEQPFLPPGEFPVFYFSFFRQCDVGRILQSS